MKCSKCGYDNYSGQHCQNCGEQFKIPSWVTVIMVINFLLMWVTGIMCLSARMVCSTYLKQGDLEHYEKWLKVFKAFSIVGLIVGVIFNLMYVYLRLI